MALWRLVSTRLRSALEEADLVDHRGVGLGLLGLSLAVVPALLVLEVLNGEETDLLLAAPLALVPLDGDRGGVVLLGFHALVDALLLGLLNDGGGEGKFASALMVADVPDDLGVRFDGFSLRRRWSLPAF